MTLALSLVASAASFLIERQPLANIVLAPTVSPAFDRLFAAIPLGVDISFIRRTVGVPNRNDMITAIDAGEYLWIASRGDRSRAESLEIWWHYDTELTTLRCIGYDARMLVVFVGTAGT